VNRSARIRLIALAIAATFVAATIALALPEGGKGQITVTAYFTKAIGLFKESHVRVLGVDIGRVTAVTPQGTQVKVVMRIEADRKIPADAHAVIVPISLIADRYVQLTPTYSSGPALKDGAVIDTAHTSIPAELDDLLAQLKKLLDAVQPGTLADPKSIGAAVANLAAALEGAGPDLSATLSGAGALSGAVTDNASALDQTVVHLANLLAALQQRRDDIAQLNTRLAQALGAVADSHVTLGRALTNISLLTQQLSSLVKVHRADLESDLSVLAKTADVLIRHQDSLIQSIRWLPVLADGAAERNNGGAIDSKNGPIHIDVRDAHLFACPPAVPATVCLLVGLSGSAGLAIPGLPASLGPPVTAGTAPTAGGRAASVAGPGSTAPSPSDPPDLLHLLSKPQRPSASEQPAILPAPTPSLRGLFDGLGGLLDRALGWLL